MGTWGFGAFENDDASGIVGGITSELEAELVSFVHRVRFEYAMHYDRARAAAALLTRLAKVGVTWSPAEDATAPLIERTFHAYFEAVPSFDVEHRRAIEADVAEFVRWFADPDVIASPPVGAEVAGALRAIGAEPAAWRWASGFGFDVVAAWKHTDSPPRRIPQVALAAGVDERTVVGAIAETLLRRATAAKHSRLGVRDALVELLRNVAAGSWSGELATRIQDASKAEGAALLKRLRERSVNASGTDDDDPLQSVLFDTAELTRTCDGAIAAGALDPYRAGDLVEKLARDSTDGAFVAAVRAQLEPAVLVAAEQRVRAPGDKISIPIGTVYRKGSKN